MISKIKIFGERHTATNAIRNMIMTSFNVQVVGFDYLGWKHRRAPKPSEWKKYPVASTLFIITVRNPYTWLKAMHRQPYAPHQPDLPTLAFRNFIKFPLEDYENVIQMWNEKNKKYLEFITQVPNAVLVRTEDFSVDQETLFDELHQHDLKGTFTPYFGYSDGMVHNQQPRNDKIKREVLTLPLIPDQVVESINDELDYDLMAKLGYQKVGACDGKTQIASVMQKLAIN